MDVNVQILAGLGALLLFVPVASFTCYFFWKLNCRDSGKDILYLTTRSTQTEPFPAVIIHDDKESRSTLM